MSWQLGALVVLSVALAGGFGWYERGHPDSRVVALVATLAALAALGRIAFAPLPNVKPSTDIVLIAGLTLGAAPGFAVGALTGLTSNFFFGQGPWTPWQMAAWGGVGLVGALWRRTRRTRPDGDLAPVGRWRLALVCAVCGLAFTALQDVGDWVNFSDHSSAQLGVYVVRGIGFDFVHAAGCLAFALAFGPALTGSIERFSARLQVDWRPLGSPLPAVILALIAVASTGVRATAVSAASTPTGYLLAAQNHDGGFGGSPGQASGGLFAGWAALGLAGAGQNPADVRHGGASLLSYVEHDPTATADAGSLERTMLVAGAAGVSADGFGGHDLPALLARQIRGDGSVSDQINLTTFAILALRATGQNVSGRSVRWLAAQQNRDGGFGFAQAGGASDIDDTGAVLEALGSHPPITTRAVHYLRANQNGDGGFPAQPGDGSNAQSTAWAVQGLLAAGVEPDTLHRHGTSPTGYLRGLIAPDGHVRYAVGSDQTPVWVTAEALLALDRRTFPLGAVARASGGSQSAAGVAGTAAGRRAARHRHRHRNRRHGSHASGSSVARTALGALLEPTAQTVADRALTVSTMVLSAA